MIAIKKVDNPLFLSKAFDIINAFDNEEEEFLTTKLTRKADVSWGYSHRAIKELCDKGYITKDKLKGRSRMVRLTSKGKTLWRLTKKILMII